MIIQNREKLRAKCHPVSLLEADGIIEKLKLELEPSGGIGLAANQVGIQARVCIIKVKELITLVNPIIVESYDLSEYHQEGCLSFPGQWIKTKRYAEIFVRDLLNPAGLVAVGLEAVALAHEIGHLNGKLMYNYEIKIPGRNELCWCKISGKKYKKCHMGKIIK